MLTVMCALNADSSSDTSASLLPEICKGLRAIKRQRLLDFSSLAAEQSSPGVLSSLDTTPHCTLSLDSLLGTFGISKKCTDQESKVLFAPLSTEKDTSQKLSKVRFQTSSVSRWRKGW